MQPVRTFQTTMKAIALCVSLLALAGAEVSPPKEPFTPFFNLYVLHSSNTSIIGNWVTVDGYESYLRISPNASDRATFYQTQYIVSNEHPQGGPVLANNNTDRQGKQVSSILGSGDCLTCGDAGLPIGASVFTKTVNDWADFGSFWIDFRIDELTHKVHFNLTEGGALSGWTKPQACWADFEGKWRLIVTKDEYKECSPLDLRWIFAGV